VLDHLIAVNRWDKPRGIQYLSRAFTIWERRSQVNDWRIDWSNVILFLQGEYGREVDIDEQFAGLFHGLRSYDRQGAIEWARRMLAENAVIVDTETTGLLEDENAEIIEIAIVGMDGKIQYDRLVRPVGPLPKRIVNMTGITAALLKGERRFGEISEEVHRRLNGKFVVAYKASFDAGMIRRAYKRIGRKPPSFHEECAMGAWHAIVRGSFPPMPGSRHRALPDAKCVLKLLRRMSKMSIHSEHPGHTSARGQA